MLLIACLAIMDLMHIPKMSVHVCTCGCAHACVCVYANVLHVCRDERTIPRSWFSFSTLCKPRISLMSSGLCVTATAILLAFLSTLILPKRESGSSQPGMWKWMICLPCFSCTSSCFSDWPGMVMRLARPESDRSLPRWLSPKDDNIWVPGEMSRRAWVFQDEGLLASQMAQRVLTFRKWPFISLAQTYSNTGPCHSFVCEYNIE